MWLALPTHRYTHTHTNTLTHWHTRVTHSLSTRNHYRLRGSYEADDAVSVAPTQAEGRGLIGSSTPAANHRSPFLFPQGNRPCAEAPPLLPWTPIAFFGFDAKPFLAIFIFIFRDSSQFFMNFKGLDRNLSTYFMVSAMHKLLPFKPSTRRKRVGGGGGVPLSLQKNLSSISIVSFIILTVRLTRFRVY